MSADKFAYLDDPNIAPPEEAYFERLDENVYQRTPSICHLDEQWLDTDPLRIETLGWGIKLRNARLRTYARVLGLNPDEYDLKEYPENAIYRDNQDYYPKEMIAAIKSAAPCNWIQKVEKFLDTSPLGKYLYLYATDYMLDIYKWIREKRITPNIENLISGMNQAIYASPRTEKPFMIYRISRFPIEVGDSMIIETPKSGTFLLNVLNEQYLQGQNSTLFRIWIPRNSIISYVPLYDQVVFPTGAEFLAVSEVQDEIIYIEGEEKSWSIQDLFYIGAPDQPLILLDELIFTRHSNETFNSVVEKWQSEQSFPFVKRY